MNLRPFIACCLAALASATHPAIAQLTGRDALAEVARVKGSAAASQIVSLTGRRGAEQPAAWNLVARDTSFPGRFRAYTVSGGRITAEVALPASESAAYASTPLDRTKLKVDSPVVFWRAHTEAEKALLGFDTVDYELRNAEFSSTPVWVVKLHDRAGGKIGELAVSAESGQVLRRAWSEAARPTAKRRGAISQPRRITTPAAAPQPTAQQTWEETRNSLNQGTKVVKSGLGKASTTVGGWLVRAGGAMQESSKTPAKPPASAPAPAPRPAAAPSYPAPAAPAPAPSYRPQP
jgi:hypothetical protein